VVIIFDGLEMSPCLTVHGARMITMQVHCGRDQKKKKKEKKKEKKKGKK
jgi:hypothetical protein